MTDHFSAALLRIQQRISHAACVALAEIHDMTAAAVEHINRSAGQYVRRQREQRKHRSKRG